MITNPLISVIVLCYNSESFITETLESIKNQSYKNLELIIADDNSKDKSIEVCQEWLSNNAGRFFYSNIITVRQNTGIPANCNRGIHAAKGEFIKIIAGDDILMKDCIKDNLEFIGPSSKRNIIISQMDAFLDGTTPKKILEHKIPFGAIFSEEFTAEDQNRFLIHTSYFGNAPTLFYRKTVFDRVQFDESIPLLEDYPFAILATNAGWKYNYLSKVTVLYRVREDSAYFKNRREIFGKFYKTKFEFDKKYRFPYLDTFTLRNEKMFYNIQKYFDEHGLNKNTVVHNLFYKTINLLNPYRYFVFFRNNINGKLK